MDVAIVAEMRLMPAGPAWRCNLSATPGGAENAPRFRSRRHHHDRPERSRRRVPPSSRMHL